MSVPTTVPAPGAQAPPDPDTGRDDPGTEVEVRNAVGLLAQGTDVPGSLGEMMTLSETLSHSSVIPAHWRRPENCFAGCLAARALDVPIWVALQAFHFVDGRLGMEATFMRALLYRAHGDFRVLHRGFDKAVIAIRRPGSTEWVEIEFTASEAQHLAKKDNWKNNPRAMLVARATTRGMREVCPDLLMGFNYSADELEDDRVRRTIDTTTVAVTVATPTAQSSNPGQNPWLAALRKVKTLDEALAFQAEAKERGLLDRELDGMTLRDRIAARMAEIAEANRAGADADGVIDAEVDDEIDGYDEIDAEDVEEAFADPAAPAGVNVTLSCGCPVEHVYSTGTHLPTCAEYTAPAEPIERRTRS